MDVFNEVLRFVMVPPLLQVLMTSVAVLGGSYILMRALQLDNPRVRSLYFSLALVAPIAMYFLYTPSIWRTTYTIFHVFTPIQGITPLGIQKIVEVNYVGIICIVGLIFGAATFIMSSLFSVSIVKRLQGVVEVTAEEEPRLCELVERVARKMGVNTPRVGLTEHLQPNAFTVGGGKRAMVVFTMGLLDSLDQRELEAVAAHELAHIKNNDFGLMSVITSLKLVFFYNPFSYLAASMISREREYLADVMGSKAISRTRQLKSALIKISSAKPVIGGNILTRLTTGLFVYSQIGSLKAAFTAHPNLDTRLRNIGGKTSQKGDAAKTAAVAVLLVSTLFFTGGYIVQPMRLVDQLLFKIDEVFGLNLFRSPERGRPVGVMISGFAQMMPLVGGAVAIKMAPLPPP